MKVYFIAGLGANKRAFQFMDLTWCEPVFIDWQQPLPNETLPQYAQRLRALIPQVAPIIVGVSFGGMLATEMAKADDKVNAIIISSNKTAAEFPASLRLWKYFPVYKWVPPSVVKITGRYSKYFVGPDGKQQKKLFQLIQSEADPVFTAWAIGAILNWQNSTVPPNVVHIHGTHDRLLPFKLVKAHHIIPNGKHIMIMDKAAEVSALLKQLLVPGM